MLTTLQDFRSEIVRLAEEVDDRDLEDGAGQVILYLFKNVDDRTEQKDILTREDLAAGMNLLLSPAEGKFRLDDGHLRPLLTALRLLWAGYYGELVVQEKHRCGEEGYRAEATKRFRDRVLKQVRPNSVKQE
jgi:hypothetical protein